MTNKLQRGSADTHSQPVQPVTSYNPYAPVMHDSAKYGHPTDKKTHPDYIDDPDVDHVVGLGYD